MSIEGISLQRRAVLDLVAIRGATHASMTLSRWFGRDVRIHTDGFVQVPMERVGEQGLESDEQIVAIHTRILGEVGGNVLLAFAEPAAFETAALLMGLDELDELGELECSALTETGNLTSSAFIGSLGTALGLRLLPGVPTLLHDVAGAILEPMLLEQFLAGSTALMVAARFEIDARAIDGWLHVMPSPESLPVLEERLQ